MELQNFLFLCSGPADKKVWFPCLENAFDVVNSTTYCPQNTRMCHRIKVFNPQYLTVLLFWVFVVYQHECDSCWHGLNLSSMLVVLVTFWRDEYFNLYKVVDTVSCHGNNISGRLDMYENWAWFNSTHQLSMAKLIILWELGALIRIDTQMFYFWSAIHAILIKMLKWT